MYSHEDKFGELLSSIQAANETRHHVTLPRRIIKIMEELGEVSEAFLNVTSTGNGKEMTWDDVREEFADVIIVAADLALTPLPDQEGHSPEMIMDEIMNTVRVKLAKWAANKRSGKNASDA